MDITLITITVAFVVLVIAFAKHIARQIGFDADQKVKNAQESFQSLLDHKNDLCDQKKDLENKAMEIFTLYDMTREITKSLKEQKVFETFKEKLNEHVSFEDCQLLDPASDQIRSLKRMGNHFVFSLQSKKKKIGYLDITGVLQQDIEKVKILSHQFALGLRRVRLYQEIERIAITDSLTEVHTRRYVLERLTEEINRSRVRKMRMSYLMVDVDHFKNFNDKYGHLTGDQILHEIGLIIKDNIREIDIAGRYGGEEFCIVLPDTDRDGAKYAAERIRQAVEQAAIKAYDTTIKATVSVGMATYPLDAKSIDELIDKADWALYRAKKQSRNRVFAFGMDEE